MANFNEGDRVQVNVDGTDQEGTVIRVGREGRALVIELANKQLRTVSAATVKKVKADTKVDAAELGKQVHEAVMEGKTATPEAKAIIENISNPEKLLKARKKKDPKPTAREIALAALPEDLKGKVTVGVPEAKGTDGSDIMAQADEMAAEATAKLKTLKPDKGTKGTKIMIGSKPTVEAAAPAPVAKPLAVEKPAATDKEKRNDLVKQAFALGLKNADVAAIMGLKQGRVSQLRNEYKRNGEVFPEPTGGSDRFAYEAAMSNIKRQLEGKNEKTL